MIKYIYHLTILKIKKNISFLITRVNMYVHVCIYVRNVSHSTNIYCAATNCEASKYSMLNMYINNKFIYIIINVNNRYLLQSSLRI